ncbi:MAG: PIG-L family deacetylase [Bryobacteraceae bacterium]
MNILAIGAHPDDVEFGCAPVLIKEIRRGNRVKLLVLSRGEAGTAGTPEVRERESRAAAARMGAEVEFLDFGGDCNLEYTIANRLAIARHIREFRPSIVLAPNTQENQHPDHSVAGKLTRDACRLARYGGLLRPLAPHKIGSLYFYNITMHSGPPDVVIDIADTIEEWEAVIRCHESQVTNKNYVDLIKAAARLLGLGAGTEYAMGLYANDPLRLDAISEISESARNF